MSGFFVLIQGKRKKDTGLWKKKNGNENLVKITIVTFEHFLSNF